jgi:hypothetical protein
MKKPNQVEARLKIALLNGDKVTPLKALNRWGCFRLAVYVQRLREKGMKIRTEMIRKSGKTFAQYTIA